MLAPIRNYNFVKHFVSLIIRL